jgi:two-component system response regulator AtoC
MAYLLSCDSVRIVAAADRRDWKRRSTHPLESQIRTAAGTRVPVLISAGKARARAIAGQIHRRSTRADRDLLVVDCSIAPNVLEEKVINASPNGTGTLVLLEIDRMPSALQTRLRARLTVEARALALGTPEALVGSRLMATCSRDLYGMVEQGTFDRDLFYRLNTIHIMTS